MVPEKTSSVAEFINSGKSEKMTFVNSIIVFPFKDFQLLYDKIILVVIGTNLSVIFNGVGRINVTDISSFKFNTAGGM